MNTHGGTMPQVRYFLSSSPTIPAPPTSKLREIEAESPQAAAQLIVANSIGDADDAPLWAHFLVWADDGRGHRGFETIRLRGG